MVGYDIEWSKNKEYLFTTTFGSKVIALDAKNFDIVAQDIVTKDEESRCENMDANFNMFPGRVFVGTDRGHVAWYEFKDKKFKR